MAWGDGTLTSYSTSFASGTYTMHPTAQTFRVSVDPPVAPALRQPASMEPLSEVAALRQRVDETCAAGRKALATP